MSAINAAIRDRVLGAMNGASKLRFLLQGVGYEHLQELAEELGVPAEVVSMCICGRRPYPEVREAIAERLSLTRAEVDCLIEGSC